MGAGHSARNSNWSRRKNPPQKTQNYYRGNRHPRSAYCSPRISCKHTSSCPIGKRQMNVSVLFCIICKLFACLPQNTVLQARACPFVQQSVGDLASGSSSPSTVHDYEELAILIWYVTRRAFALPHSLEHSKQDLVTQRCSS